MAETVEFDLQSTTTIPNASVLTVDQYQAMAVATDNLRQTQHPLDLVLLGALGEVGSAVAEVKKRGRGDRPNKSYELALQEELGDTLWYCAVTCERLGVRLSEVLCKSTSQHGVNEKDVRFAELQIPFSVHVNPTIEEALDASLKLAAEIGHTISAYKNSRSEFVGAKAKSFMIALMAAFLEIASVARVDVQKIAHDNLSKTFDRWPVARHFPPLLDGPDMRIEQFPRQLQVDLFERKIGEKTFVYQRCSTINIGDPLTDNKEDPDDYRFHDVFHYAYAAVLGWSPVLRALFKLKRKSNKTKDENQDGARAILIEEGVASWVFSQALEQDLFEHVEYGKLSYDLLKTVRQFVSGYEVDNSPLWVWEEAILSGFRCFRYLVKHRKGRLTLDLNRRSIEIGEIPT